MVAGGQGGGGGWRVVYILPMGMTVMFDGWDEA